MPRRPSPARGDQIQQLTAKIMLGHQHLPAVIQADVINGSAGEPAGTAAGRSGYGRPDPPTAGPSLQWAVSPCGAAWCRPARSGSPRPSSAHCAPDQRSAPRAVARPRPVGRRPGKQRPARPRRNYRQPPPHPDISHRHDRPAGRPWPEPGLPHSQDLAPPPPHSERAQPSAAGGQHADRGAGSLWTACGHAACDGFPAERFTGVWRAVRRPRRYLARGGRRFRNGHGALIRPGPPAAGPAGDGAELGRAVGRAVLRLVASAAGWDEAGYWAVRVFSALGAHWVSSRA